MKSLENKLIKMMVRLDDLKKRKTSLYINVIAYGNPRPISESDYYLYDKLWNGYYSLIEKIEKIDDENTGMYFLKEYFAREYFGTKKELSNWSKLPVDKRVKLILELFNN